MGWFARFVCVAVVAFMLFSIVGVDVRGAQGKLGNEFEYFSDDQMVHRFPSTPMSRGWRLTHSGWDTTDHKMLAAVFSETAEILMQHVTPERVKNIDVAVFSWDLLPPNPNYGGRSYTSGEVFNVYLKSYGDDWRRYVSVYSHELCHVLDANSRTPQSYRWFEEALCQVASLYTLRTLSERWAESDSSYKRAYAPKLREYFDFLLLRKESELPRGHSLASWYSNHGNGLRNRWENYSQNDVIARKLFPYFLAYPGAWDSLTWLREAGDARDLAEYFARWQFAAPVHHRPFIRVLASEFGYVLAPTDAPSELQAMSSAASSN